LDQKKRKMPTESPLHSPPRETVPAPPGDEFTLHAGCEFIYRTQNFVPVIAQVQARPEPVPVADRYQTLSQAWSITHQDGREIDVRHHTDEYGNRVARFTLPPGETRFGYDGRFSVPTSADPQVLDAGQALVEDIPDDVLVYLLSSRYCHSDVVSDQAWQLFGNVAPGWARVQAVCDWLHQNIEYKSGASDPFTTAVDVLNQSAGICRDFANTGITFCRALNIPARYCFGYMPDVGVVPPDTPMDFHAWFEAWLVGPEGGAWHTFDARHNFPRIGRVPIARGRDAVDCAMITNFGSAQLISMTVWAAPADA
jgi:transglutaminase-like putative cysteine protease